MINKLAHLLTLNSDDDHVRTLVTDNYEINSEFL